MYEFGWHLGPAPLPPYLCSYSAPINLSNTSSLASGCVRNSPSAAVARSRGTIGGVEHVNHPALAPPRLFPGEHQPIQGGTWQGEKPPQDSQRNQPRPTRPQGCPRTASSPAGTPSTTGLWERLSVASQDLRGLGHIMGCRQDHLGMALITEQVQEMRIKG